jgi:hypothetical protein
MKYYIRRDLNEYGPYTLADLQRYVAQGNISLSDLTRSEGMTDWVPVSQVIGNIPPPAPSASPYPAAPAASPAGSPSQTAGTVYSGAAAYGSQPVSALAGPMPPDFHWALVLLIGFFTCGIFLWVWLLVEAAFVKKIRPQSNALIFGIVALICSYGGQFIRVFDLMNHRAGISPFGGLVGIASIVLYFVAVFTMKSELEQYYNSVEPINLRLNGVMVFFFAVFYFQHHFTRISRWKKTGILEPQG